MYILFVRKGQLITDVYTMCQYYGFLNSVPDNIDVILLYNDSPGD
jgi:hypothetical protein